MDQTIRFCTTADGVRLAYAVSGDGPPLVMSATWLTHLEHQWHSLAWRPWLDAFTREFEVLRHDSRGCGLSDRNVGDLSFETWVSDLECVVEAAGFRRFAIVGTCWGGPIAVEYAVRHPERVSHLVLYGTYARGKMRRTDTPAEAKRGTVLGDLTRLGWGQENHAFVQIWSSLFQPGGTPEHSRSWCDQMPAATSAETAIRLFQIAAHTDVRDVAPQVRCPALVVHSERDMIAPMEEGRLLASLLPDSRFVQLDSDNHMLLADEPAWQRLVVEVRRFLAEPSNEVVTCRKSLSLDELTPRERTVLEAIAQGLNNPEIAQLLRLSEKTVRNHITRIFDKIRVKHRYQAIVMAREAGLGGAASPPVAAEAGHLSRAPDAVPTPRQDIGLNTTAFARPITSARRAPATPARRSR
ncbi:alpha/beta fold hydrolase [Bradyrhizobium sp. th.b2]|uniref:alpha/beta fold hydrolase n=1 Tax=Bradyrhizobium sp. th-b2 TaxID=172088 RepID=UPI000687FAB8|nr:alpha/beta fold hydrolase [Bradyrhizobium sp. th.b2]